MGQPEEDEAVEKRRTEGLDRIMDEVGDRQDAGAPGVPAAPVEGVPYVAPRIPPGKVEGATATAMTAENQPQYEVAGDFVPGDVENLEVVGEGGLARAVIQALEESPVGIARVRLLPPGKGGT